WKALLTETIDEMGFTIHDVWSVEQAEIKLKRRFCQLVIVDLNLKGGEPGNQDGKKLLKWIRQMGEGTQSLVVTGYATPQIWRDILKSEEAFDVLEKEDFAKIPLKIRQGLARAREVMLSQSIHTPLGIKGINASQIEQRFGLSWNLLTT